MNTLTRKGILSLACILAFIMPSAAFWRDEVQALAEESLLSSSSDMHRLFKPLKQRP